MICSKKKVGAKTKTLKSRGKINIGDESGGKNEIVPRKGQFPRNIGTTQNSTVGQVASVLVFNGARKLL